MKSNWTLQSSTSYEKVQEIANKIGISCITAELLLEKGYKTPEEMHRFLNPRIEDLYDPFLFPEMDKAVHRIVKAIKGKEKILIYGDYDVDGTTGTSLLYNTLKTLSITPEIYIPHRVNEGYGLSKEGVEHCLKSYVNLIITVDCGMGAGKLVEVLQNNGIDVIVTDHHEIVDTLPPAFAVINPVLEGYPFHGLSGCGVAFKLAQAIYRNLEMDETPLLEYLDFVALATVCDVVPMIDENRIFVKHGLKKLHKTKNIGLQSLIESAKLKNYQLNPYHLGFILGPRINAQGRLKSAKEIITLFTTTDRGEADKITQDLEIENARRKTIQESIIKEANNELKSMDIKDKRVIILAKEGWHPGVIGIAASKIAEQFYRPAILIALDKDIGKGSARSIPEFDLYKALYQCKDILDSFGGHQFAAGITIKPCNIQSLRDKLEAIASQELSSENLVPKFNITKEIVLSEVTENLVSEIKKMGPFGEENLEPLFLIRNVQVVGYPKTVKKDHIKFKLRNGKTAQEAIGFGLAKIPIDTGNYIDLIFELSLEKWLDREKIVLKIKDIDKL